MHDSVGVGRMQAALALLVAVLVLVLGACGGGGSKSSAGGQPAGSALTGGSAGGSHARVGQSRGSGKTSRPGATSQPGRASFIQHADRICQEAHQGLVQVGRAQERLLVAAQHHRLSVASYYLGTAALTARAADVALRAIRQVGGLRRPPDRRVDSYLSVSSAESQALRAEAVALRRGDTRVAAALKDRVVAMSRRAHDLATSYGFHSCGGTAR